MASEPSANTNLLRDAGTPLTLPDEAVELIASGKGVRIERIVSTGHVSPDEFWYDSEECEWVTVLSGEGKLRFENDDEVALVHGPAAAGYRAASEPMVNIRATLARANERRITDQAMTRRLIGVAKALPYGERKWAAVFEAANAQSSAVGARLQNFVSNERVDIHVKEESGSLLPCRC